VDPRQSLRMQETTVPRIAPQPPPSLARPYKEDSKNGLTAVFSRFDEEMRRWFTMFMQALNVQRDETDRSSGGGGGGGGGEPASAYEPMRGHSYPQRLSQVLAWKKFLFDDNNILIRPAAMSVGQDFAVDDAFLASGGQSVVGRPSIQIDLTLEQFVSGMIPRVTFRPRIQHSAMVSAVECVGEGSYIAWPTDAHLPETSPDVPIPCDVVSVELI
jgi:hypothetical protein